MTDREKVIKGLEKCRRFECDDCTEKGASHAPWDCPAYDDFVDSALALLKAQEPVKPTRYQEGRWFKSWRCGACGSMLVFRNGTDKPKYCIDCGRAVKWDA